MLKYQKSLIVNYFIMMNIYIYIYIYIIYIIYYIYILWNVYVGSWRPISNNIGPKPVLCMFEVESQGSVARGIFDRGCKKPRSKQLYVGYSPTPHIYNIYYTTFGSYIQVAILVQYIVELLFRWHNRLLDRSLDVWLQFIRRQWPFLMVCQN